VIRLIYDIGDLITLTSIVVTNDGPAVLTVTDPSGTPTVTPGIAFTSNAYTGTYAPLVAGRFAVKWATASNVAQDVFDVRSTTIGVISLDDVRAWLRLRTVDVGDNEKLLALIETASDLISDVTGPLLPTTYTEQFSGGKPHYTVMHPPLLSITTMTEFWGNQAKPLTEQPLGFQTNPYGFTVDYTTGQITRRTFGGDASIFAQGVKNVVVTYVAQLSPIPNAIQMATRELVKHLYNNTQIPSGKARVGGADADFSAPIAYAIPNFVLDMIPLKYRRPPGIA
jgi:hypothetical protein